MAIYRPTIDEPNQDKAAAAWQRWQDEDTDEAYETYLTEKAKLDRARREYRKQLRENRD